MNYKLAEQYILRRPMYPINMYYDLCTEEENEDKMKDVISLVCKNNILMESIYIASNSLYNALLSIKDNDILSKQDTIKIYRSLKKYIARASIRTTPFGLFAGVSMGSFADETNVSINDKYNKRVRADMRWVYKVIQKLEDDQYIYNNIFYRINDICYKARGRIVNPYISLKGEGENYANIKHTNAIKLVMDKLTNKQFSFADIENLLKDNYSGINDEIIQPFVKTLIDNELIISELRIPLFNINSLEFLLEILKKRCLTNNLINKVEEVHEIIDLINSCSLGESKDLYIKCVKKMKSLVEYDGSYLQCDLKMGYEKNNLGPNVKKNLEELVSNLVRHTRGYSKSYILESYANAFLDAYGHYKEIPLLHLLDQDIGLGDPKTHIKGNHNKVENKIERIILNKLVKIPSNVINLTEADFEKITDKNEDDDPYSFELALNLLARSKDEIDEGNYLLSLSPMLGSSEALKSLGRFTDLFDEEETQHIYKILTEKEEIAIRKGQILVEGHEAPAVNLLGNLCQNTTKHKYQVAINSNILNDFEQIYISDLYVGLNPQTKKFYIKSKSLNKKIKFSSLNMVNSKLQSSIYQFLLTTSPNKNDILQLISDLLMINWEHVPRITYENLILIPERWNIMRENLVKINSYNDFKTLVEKTKKEFNIPNFVMHVKGDNIFPVNLENDLELKEIYKEYNKNPHSSIEFRECLYLDRNLWITSQEKLFVGEFVVSFLAQNKDIKNDNIKKHEIGSLRLSTTSNVHEAEKNILIDDHKRRLLPGEENWWYYKIYFNDLQNKRLFDEIYQLCNVLIDNKIIQKYFFIRYADPKRHYRVRFKLNDESYTQSFITMVTHWAKKNTEGLLLNNLVIDIYDRELERYGGKECIEYVEDYFHWDSALVQKIFQSLNDENNLSEFAFIIINNMFEVLNIDLDERLKIFAYKNYKDKNRKQYKEKRKRYMQYVDKNSQYISENFSDELKKVLENRNTALIEYWNRVELSDQQGLLTNTKMNLLSSLIHMFCNRLDGNRENEEFILSIIRHATYDVIGYRRYMVKSR